jgi:hypothetical protein
VRLHVAVEEHVAGLDVAATASPWSPSSSSTVAAILGPGRWLQSPTPPIECSDPGPSNRQRIPTDQEEESAR